MSLSEWLTIAVQMTAIMSVIGGVISYIFLQPLNQAIKNLQLLITNTQEQQRLIDLRLARVEESTKSAHHRIDGIDDLLHHGGWGRSMFEKKIGQLSYFKPNESVYKKYGYNTKAACQAIYHLKMVMKFLQNLEYGIDAPMAKAIDCSDISDEINKIRNGGYTLKELQKIADNTLADYDGIMAIPPSKGVPGWYLQAIYHAVEDEVTNGSAD